MKKFVLLITGLFLIPNIAFSGTFARYGIGVFRSNEYGSAAVKSFSVGHTESLLGPVIQQVEGGYFGDSSGHNRKGSGFGNYGVGLEANPGYFVLRSTWGVGAITSPDSMLGGPFQFNHDLLLGVKGDNGALIGVDLKHISSAGIELPNLGRDFLLIHLELPF